MSERLPDDTFEPGTLGATPSSADAVAHAGAVDGPPTASGVSDGPSQASGRAVDRPASPPVSSAPMWILGVVLLLDAVDQSVVRGMIGPLQEEFGVGDTGIGLLTSAFILVNGLVTVPAGYLADRWHRTRTVGHTVLLWSGITAAGAAAPNFATLVGVRAALGFGQAVTEPAAASLIGDYYPTERRGTAFSVQQVMIIAGLGLGVGIGGVVGNALGLRAGFLVVAVPGILVAMLAYRLREPKRGAADRLHVGVLDADDEVEAEAVPLFEDGFRTFLRDMAVGLRQDMRTIWDITTMRYAVVGVAVLLFAVNAIGTWLPQFYERQLGIDEGYAEAWFTALMLGGGVPGIVVGGRVADRWMPKVKGGRVALPAVFVFVGNTLFTLSYAPVPIAVTLVLQGAGLFMFTMAIPGLRAGLSDAIPANLRGAGFGAFNLVAMVFGAAAAPNVVAALSEAFDNNLRTAFLLVSPVVYLGALILFRARTHLEADAMKIFEAVRKAMQEQQERDAQRAAARPAPAAGD